MRLSVIYDSKTGNTRQAAAWIVEGMNSVPGVCAEIFSIHDVDEGFVKDSKGVVIGSPSYAANMTPDMRTWLLMSAPKLGLAGKLGGAFATVQYTHGGGELVIQSIMNTELVYGMLYYSSGSGCGEPFIHIGPVGVNGNKEAHNMLENYKNYFLIYGQRFAAKAVELFGERVI